MFMLLTLDDLLFDQSKEKKELMCTTSNLVCLFESST